MTVWNICQTGSCFSSTVLGEHGEHGVPTGWTLVRFMYQLMGPTHKWAALLTSRQPCLNDRRQLEVLMVFPQSDVFPNLSTLDIFTRLTLQCPNRWSTRQCPPLRHLVRPRSRLNANTLPSYVYWTVYFDLQFLFLVCSFYYIVISCNCLCVSKITSNRIHEHSFV